MCGLAADAASWQEVKSPHGTKYLVDGAIQTPVGERPVVRSIWIIDRGGQSPRLVTAYPQG